MKGMIFEFWKQQADSGMRMMEAMAQAGAKLRAMQQAAAEDAQRRTLEAGKAVGEAKGPQEVWQAQYELTMGNCESAAAYWRNVFQALNELNGRMLECAKSSTPASPPPGDVAGDKSTALTMPGDLALRLWNDMYRQVDSFTRSLADPAVAGVPPKTAKERKPERKQDQPAA
jgi:hypothetical protein